MGYSAIEGGGGPTVTPLHVGDLIQHDTGWIGIVFKLRCVRCGRSLIDGRLDCHINDPQFQLLVWDGDESGGCVKIFDGRSPPFHRMFIGPLQCAWGKVLSDSFPDGPPV